MTNKVREHLNKAFSVNLPNFVVYFFMLCAGLFVGYVVILHVRIHRKKELLKASSIRIQELETKARMAEYKGMKKIASKTTTLSREKIKKIDDELKVLKKKEEEIQHKTGRMTPQELLKSFKEEGFN